MQQFFAIQNKRNYLDTKYTFQYTQKMDSITMEAGNPGGVGIFTPNLDD